MELKQAKVDFGKKIKNAEHDHVILIDCMKTFYEEKLGVLTDRLGKEHQEIINLLGEID